MVGYSYPVLYITDGDYMPIPTATRAVVLTLEQEVPEISTVGIGYGDSAMDSMERREEEMISEGLAPLVQFLQKERIPDIEINYRADPTLRTLMGHLLWGEFSLSNQEQPS